MSVASTLCTGVVAGVVLFGCGSGTPMTPLMPPTSVLLAVFTDTDGFATTDVLDADDEIVRFDLNTNSILWFDNMAYEGFPVTENFVRDDRFFQVRFGTDAGQKRAYFTETSAGTVCDISIQNGQIQIISTSRLPPIS